jgi:hypothetical protein
MILKKIVLYAVVLLCFLLISGASGCSSSSSKDNEEENSDNQNNTTDPPGTPDNTDNEDSTTNTTQGPNNTDNEDSSTSTTDDSNTNDPSNEGPVTWVDEATGLEWQRLPHNEVLIVSDAKKYCDELELNGHSDWRLPDISELRSLIRDCSATITGGECPVTAECVESMECRGHPQEETKICRVNDCEINKGGGKDGCYWPVELSGVCSSYISSSTTGPGTYWDINFVQASLDNERGHASLYTTYHVRCVRGN